MNNNRLSNLVPNFSYRNINHNNNINILKIKNKKILFNSISYPTRGKAFNF